MKKEILVPTNVAKVLGAESKSEKIKISKRELNVLKHFTKATFIPGKKPLTKDGKPIPKTVLTLAKKGIIKLTKGRVAVYKLTPLGRKVMTQNKMSPVKVVKKTRNSLSTFYSKAFNNGLNKLVDSANKAYGRRVSKRKILKYIEDLYN